MHDTAFATGSKFLEIYASVGEPVIVELGSYDYNGTLRNSSPPNASYIGLDVQHGPGVDIVITPTQPLPLRADYADFIVSTSQMEHDPRFWVTFLELCRITKDGGAIFINAPANGMYHSYPTDVWRFFPDAGKALASWACENGFNVSLYESFHCARQKDVWNDFVAVFHKGERKTSVPAAYIHDDFAGWNVWKHGADKIERLMAPSEDMMIIENLRSENAANRLELEDARERIRVLEQQILETQESAMP